MKPLMQKFSSRKNKGIKHERFALEYSCNRSYHWIIIPPDRLFHHILNYLQITMKRISFNDKYGLTKAVLEGRKTQERRIITCPSFYKGIEVRGFYVYCYPRFKLPISESNIYKTYQRKIAWPKELGK